jgi:hypothetical protein
MLNTLNIEENSKWVEKFFDWKYMRLRPAIIPYKDYILVN